MAVVSLATDRTEVEVGSTSGFGCTARKGFDGGRGRPNLGLMLPEPLAVSAILTSVIYLFPLFWIFLEISLCFFFFFFPGSWNRIDFLVGSPRILFDVELVIFCVLLPPFFSWFCLSI